jgi:hypothetical protein
MRMNNLRGVVLQRNMIYLSLLLKSPPPLTVLKAARGKGALCYLVKIMVRKLKSCYITLIIVCFVKPLFEI